MCGSTLLPRGATWSTTSTAAWRSAGSPPTAADSASTPPADAPTTITGTLPSSIFVMAAPASLLETLAPPDRASDKESAGLGVDAHHGVAGPRQREHHCRRLARERGRHAGGRIGV